jgi:uncharacterized membrane protein
MKNKFNYPDFIALILGVMGFVFLLSSVMYIANDDKWFSRLFISLVSFGLSAIIIKMK